MTLIDMKTPANTLNILPCDCTNYWGFQTISSNLSGRIETKEYFQKEQPSVSTNKLKISLSVQLALGPS